MVMQNGDGLPCHSVDVRTLHRICNVVSRCQMFFNGRDMQNAAIFNAVVKPSPLSQELKRIIEELKAGGNWIP